MMDRLEVLRSGVISHHLPHFGWMNFMLGIDKFLPRVRSELTGNRRQDIQKWEKEELGITRYPTTVLAVSQDSKTLEQFSVVESMVLSNRIQWEALRVAR